MKDVTLVVGIGLALGLGASLAVTRYIASFLYGVTANRRAHAGSRGGFLRRSRRGCGLPTGAAGIAARPYERSSRGIETMNWKRRERDLDSELRSHLEMAATDARARGESADAARLAALREFGNRDLVKETTRDIWGRNPFHGMGGDFARGCARLARTPASRRSWFSLSRSASAPTPRSSVWWTP